MIFFCVFVIIFMHAYAFKHADLCVLSYICVETYDIYIYAYVYIAMYKPTHEKAGALLQ
jgi:hypothetical protein